MIGPMRRQAPSPDRRLGLVIVAMTIGNAIILVSQTAVPLALPSVMHDFRVGSGEVQWVLTASLLPLAGLMVLGGRLGDLFGLRRMFVMGSIVFGAASLVAGLAPTFELLVLARAIQGVGGALLLPTSVAIVSAVAGEKDAGRALGTLGGAAAVAGAMGPIIGGALTGAFGWRAVMLVNLPLAALSVLGALRVVPADPPRTQRARVDLVGAVLLCLTLVGIVFGIGQSQSWGWSSPGVWLPLAIAVVTGIAFVLVERRVAVPRSVTTSKPPNRPGSTPPRSIPCCAATSIWPSTRPLADMPLPLPVPPSSRSSASWRAPCWCERPVAARST